MPIPSERRLLLNTMENAEKKLIEQLKQGDERAYSYLYDSYYVLLCCIANSYVKDSFTAETIVSDVIFHMWEIRSTLNITLSLTSYLSRAVRNHSLNYLASGYERNELQLSFLLAEEMPDEEVFVSDDTPQVQIERREMLKRAYDSINRLPKECREVFKKSRLEEKTYTEIADELGISVNTVKYHMKNAIASLQGDLRKRTLFIVLVCLGNL